MKALAIWNDGGLDESSLESPLFVAGLLALVVTSAAFAAVTEGRPLALRAAAAGGGVVAGTALTVLIQNAIAKPLLPDSTGWVEEEAGLWVSAALVAAVVFWWSSRRRRGQGIGSRT